MKKISIILFALMLLLTGCKKAPVGLNVTDVFTDETTGSVEVIEGNDLDLTQFLKDKETYTYSYNLMKVEEAGEKNVELEFVSLEKSTITFDEAGEYMLTLHGEDKKGNFANLYKTVKVTTIDDALGDTLANVEKNADLDELLNKYGLKYEGTVDTQKAGVYSIKVSGSGTNSNIVYKTVVVAKDELEDGKIVVEDEKGSNTSVAEDTEKAQGSTNTDSTGGSTSGTSSSNKLDKNDPRIALAYSWEGIGGKCGQVAFNYAQAVGYLKDFTYEDFLLYQITDKFDKLDSPIPFSTLIEYDDGAHVAIYLGDGMALHGNYTGDYANGNGKAKVASMYISGMEITSYKNLNVVTRVSNEDLKNEVIESTNPPVEKEDPMTAIKKECDDYNASGVGTCTIDENGNVSYKQFDTEYIFNNDNPMTETSYDPALCNNKFSVIDKMTDSDYPQLNEFCAIYYPDSVTWD